MSRVGSCALATVISDNKLYAANIGDCKGVILSVNSKNEVKARKVN
jgi:serine/threonine protein phosphatase PrpC